MRHNKWMNEFIITWGQAANNMMPDQSHSILTTQPIGLIVYIISLLIFKGFSILLDSKFNIVKIESQRTNRTICPQSLSVEISPWQASWPVETTPGVANNRSTVEHGSSKPTSRQWPTTKPQATVAPRENGNTQDANADADPVTDPAQGAVPHRGHRPQRSLWDKTKTKWKE